MPDKYEREIEDILRNLKSAEPKTNIRREPRRESFRPGKRLPPLNFSERCLVIALVAALFAGGWSYALGEGNVLTGFIALVGVVCVALVALSPFIMKQRPTSRTWR